MWWNFSKTVISKLYVAYNNIFRILCHEPKWCRPSASLMFVSCGVKTCLMIMPSASLMFVSCGVKTCLMIIRNYVFKFIIRTQESDNELIQQIFMSDAMFNSFIRVHWMKLLFVNTAF